MASIYTHGIWRVRAGQEDEFVAAWQELAEWALNEIDGAQGARLLQNRDEPTHFYTFGPWDDAASVQRFREHPGFTERMARVRETLQDGDLHTLEVRLEIGNP
ncbi:MAG TPA: antibiotic biosynthesis monooxygenase family protein [Actinomycetota bacterium]|nr:antibiotic biosynthesis monooxygenase family protein [Actinomycetota bacterium]